MTIEEAILKTRDDYGCPPPKINDGECDGFAAAIAGMVPGAEDIWGDELRRESWSPGLPDWFLDQVVGGHCFIRYENRFYDSECPQGCEYPDELPYFIRELKNKFAIQEF